MNFTKRLTVAALLAALAFTSLMPAYASSQISDRLALQQEAEKAWLGVGISDTDAGVIVSEVASGSPAEDAGLQVGDLILAIDGDEVTSSQMLSEAVQGHVPSDEVTLTVRSGDDERDVTVILGTRPADIDQRPQVGSNFEGMLDFLGVQFEWTDEGLAITRIDAASALAGLGFQEGDVITAINGESVEGMHPRDLMQLLRGGEALTFTVLRDGTEVEIEVDLSDLNIMPLIPDGQGFMMGEFPLQLGVQFTTLTADIAAEKGLSVTEGALIEEVVDDTPAAEAGLQVGDVITAVDGDQVDEEHTLPDRLAAYEEDDVVMLSVLRGEETLDIEVTLGPNVRGHFQFFMPGLPEGHPTIPSQPDDTSSDNPNA